MQGKICVIAGTTGIGAASARLFGEQGGRIVAVGRTKEHCDQLGRELTGLGIENIVIAQDLTEQRAAEEVMDRAIRKFGRIDVLFHVAGISGRRQGDGPLAECSDEGWDVVMSTNLRSMMRMNRACIRHWLAAGTPGVILNMASVLGFSFATEHFQTVAYAAAKAGIIGMSRHAAATYAANGIRINVIAPALVDTPMAGRAINDAEISRFLKRKQPLRGEALLAEDCAQAALFLCSDESSAITGSVLPVDAGWCVSG
jgi:NAD(P)-dependent dehydrogenase (short-subunit alcohol dehydrogenase family)